MAHSKIDRAKEGAWGELLVQQQLLAEGVDSARMTADYGIDLLAYDRASRAAFSVQVKTRTPRQKGKLFSWGVRAGKEKDADLFAFVIHGSEENLCWFLTPDEFRKFAARRKPLLVLRVWNSPSMSRKVNALRVDELEEYRYPEGLKRFVQTFRANRHNRAKAAGA